jgi:hypothetical protein
VKVPERTGMRPVIKALRVGVHCASVLKFVKRIPSDAN